METIMFEQNLGSIDRIVRILAGVGLLALVFVGPQTAWGYLGLIPLLTGVIGFCPAYCPLGLSSCRVRTQ
jgi:cadmium resistance protein CadD (predicted permease)